MGEVLDAVLTPKEVAAALKLSEKSVVQYLREGRLPGFRVGKHWRMRRADLAALVGTELRPVAVPVPVPSAPPTPMVEARREDQRKAAVLARLRAMQAEGLSLQAISNTLNREGVPTLSGKGRWQKGTIGNMLQAEGES